MSIAHLFFSKRQEDRQANKSEEETVSSLFGEPQKISTLPANRYHVAIQGCCHGELNKIYEGCAAHERTTGRKIDFLICCGDFQSMRVPQDLRSMAAPEKYLQLGDFHEYWTPDPSQQPPQRFAPYLTIFVGGNHENSDWLAEESYGGFLAPNIYYLGHSGVITIDNCICIAGLSGIFKAMDYQRPYPPRPYAGNERSKRSAYHVRRIEVEKLRRFFHIMEEFKSKQGKGGRSPNPANGTLSHSPVHTPVNFVVSHDWPVGITKYGDESKLIQQKPYFEDDIAHHALGNPHTLELLRSARPNFWLAAHLHCHFSAKVRHTLDAKSAQPSETSLETTEFIALDKCSKKYGFLDFVDVTTSLQSNRQETTSWADRIQRHPLWLRVIYRTHPFVLSNDCRGAQLSLDQDALCEANLNNESEAVRAPNTAALLRALQLDSAVPLHQAVRMPVPVTVCRPSPPAAPVCEPPAAPVEALDWEVDLSGTSL